MTHQLILEQELFPLMYEGRKEFVMKPYIEENKNFKDSETINVQDELTGLFYTGIITRVSYFNSVDEVFDMYSYKKFLPLSESKDLAKKEILKTVNEDDGLIVFKITRISEISD